MKVNQKGMDALHRHRWAGSQITYLEVGNDLFTNWKWLVCRSEITCLQVENDLFLSCVDWHVG